ncbi:MAG: DUF3450 domain-containing protein [Candidatus Krumholzibacteriia bacterium]
MPRIRPRWWPLIVVWAMLVLAALMGRRPAPAAARTTAGDSAPAVVATAPAPGAGAAAPAAAALADAVQQDLRQSIAVRQETQQQQDAWAAERLELTARYRDLQRSVEDLQERRSAEEARLQALQERASELRRRMVEAERLEASLEDTLRTTMVQLAAAVETSLPFLPDERAARLQAVGSELARPEVAPAEKLRRVLEALQVETQYGGTVEVYRDRIEVAGQVVHADILRLGRLALFWSTPDRSRVGTFALAGGRWLDLPGRHHRAVLRAIEMASRLRPVEVIGLPLGSVDR